MIQETALKQADRLRVFESDYGRDFGWFVEKEGTVVAVLVDHEREDMFWDSYRVEPGEGTSLPEGVFTPEFWHSGGLTFRNRVTGEIAVNAFSGGTTATREHPRVIMRGLYSDLRPALLERIILWYRRSR